jgi:TonB-linked SusC/RagA family outer membrane protein
MKNLRDYLPNPKLIMKITCIQLMLLLVFTSLSLANTGMAQELLNRQVSVHMEDRDLRLVLNRIAKVANVKFTYVPQMIPATKKVSLHSDKERLETVLDRLLTPLEIDYKVSGDYIVLRKEPGKKSDSGNQQNFANPAAEINITGKVTDEQGAALPGVSIILKGTQRGTSTGTEGTFDFDVPDQSAVLIFSFVGYVTREIELGNARNITVSLFPENKALGEVVVVGYGSQRKQDITGSVSVVDVKSMKSIPTGSAVQALQGQASGVNIISSGVPGGGSNIFIRGITSFGNTGPLVLVDGVPGNLNDIRSDEVESIQVLKDAGAAAIYGVRGANGVIVVTTKKGKKGQPVVSYESFYGQQLPLGRNPFNLLNSNDFEKLTLVANPKSNLFKNGMPDYLYAGPGITGTAMEGNPAVDPSKYQFDPSNTPNNYLIQKVNKSGTDWFREVFKAAPITSHNLSVSGGTDKSSYLLSLGYFDQTGTLLNTYLKRYSLKVNTEFKVTDHIRIGQNAYAYYKKNAGLSNQNIGNSISHIYRMMPIVPVYDIRGNFGGSYAGPELGSGENPVAKQARTENDRNNTWSAVGNVYAEIDFLKNFTLRSSIGGTVTNNYTFNITSNSYNDAFFNNRENGLNESSGFDNSVIWTNTLKFNKAFGKHNVSVLAGSESIKNEGRSLGGGANGFYATDPDYMIIGNGTKNLTAASSAYVDALFSVFGRLDYAYHDKYLLGVTVRRDGSSRFGSESRYGTFPSFSAGWRVSEEPFMKNIRWINDFKLKASYGILGSQNNVNPENAYSLYGSTLNNSYYDHAGTGTGLQQGFYQSRNGNPRTSWEQNVITNVGFDALVLNNQVELSAEYYRKSINGLLFPEPLPATAGGATAPTINIGDIRNTGMDISATYRGRVGENFRFSLGANITTYRNLVVSIPDPGYFESSGGGSILGTLVRNQEGQPVSSFFGYKVIGLFNSEADVASAPKQNEAAPGRFRYQDTNGDGSINTDDRTFLGNPNPDFTYGFNLGSEYKRFDFSAMLYGSQGNDVLNHVRYFTDFFSNPGGKSNVLLNAWTPENTNTNVPKVESVSSFSSSGVANSYYVENGSYLRLKSLQIGYTLNPKLGTKLGLNKLRIYLQTANLFTLTKYKGLDPELSGSSSSFGIDFGNYPNNQKSFLAGISLSF